MKLNTEIDEVVDALIAHGKFSEANRTDLTLLLQTTERISGAKGRLQSLSDVWGLLMTEKRKPSEVVQVQIRNLIIAAQWDLEGR
jgi:hypothetical protein